MRLVLTTVFATLLTLAGAPHSAVASGVDSAQLDHNKALSRRSLQLWASGNSDNPNEVFAASYRNHQESDAHGGDREVDLAGWKAIVQEVHQGFSDFRVEILQQIAQDDQVATRWRFSATQTGIYLGHPASGKRASWTGVQIDRFEHGKIVESWVDWDKYHFFKQLGLLH